MFFVKLLHIKASGWSCSPQRMVQEALEVAGTSQGYVDMYAQHVPLTQHNCNGLFVR